MSTSVIAPPRRPEIKTSLPGPKGQKIVEADAKFVNPSYPRPSFKLVAERAKSAGVEGVVRLEAKLDVDSGRKRSSERVVVLGAAE